MAVLPDNTPKEIWEMIKKYIPQPIILVAVIYILLIIGGKYVYNAITANDKVTSEMYSKYTNVFVVFCISLTVIAFIVGIIICIVKNKNNRKNNKIIPETSEMPKGKIEAYIVEQDETSRDSMFNEINDNVKKTYWVLGISLTSVVNREATLNKMVKKKKASIRLCMMNPDIAIDNLCTTSIEKNACILNGLIEEVKNRNIKLEDLKERVADVNECDDLLEIYHILINAIHFNEYYATAINYKETIKNSRDNLLSIKQNIDKRYGEGFFDLRFADSFMPMSLTISDAYEKDGHMIVEFHLPFTQHKVLFELFRDTNEELFEVFVAFYENIWDRAKRANNE